MHGNCTNLIRRWRSRLPWNRSAYVLAAHLPKPDALPSVHADFGPYLAFDLNFSALWAVAAELYYFILAPSVTVSRIAVIGSAAPREI